MVHVSCVFTDCFYLNSIIRKALKLCRLLLHRKWSEWARTSNNSLNECTAQEPYIKTVNVSTLWSCREPARLHLSAALCGRCPPLLFLLPLLFSRCSRAGCVQPSSDCERDAERHCLDYITMATLLPEHRWLQRGFTQRRMCVRRGGSHVHASSPSLSHTHSFCVTCLFSLFPFIHIQHLHISFLSPPLPHSLPPHTHIYHMHCHVLFQLFPAHSSFPLSNAVHAHIPTPHCILSFSHLDTQARPGSLHPSVTDDINCHRGNNQRWRQQWRQHAGPSGIHPSVFLYGSVNTCKSFKP